MGDSQYGCLLCNKNYSTYKSLWTHNKIHHNGVKTVKSSSDEKDEVGTFECRKCNKKYAHRQSRHNHEKQCIDNGCTNAQPKENGVQQLITDNALQIAKQNEINLVQENLKLDKQIEYSKSQKELVEMKIKLRSMKKIDAKTFKAVNKILMDRSTNNTMNNSNNTNSLNTNIINYNFPNITSLGGESVQNTITQAEKKQIIDSKRSSLEAMVQIVHCGDHDIFKNIVITNLKDKFAYKYDKDKGYFTSSTKNIILEELFTYRVMDLEAIYDELSSANMIDIKTKQIIQKFLDQLENKDTYVDDTGEYADFKTCKMNSIKILLYNNQDKITKDIALLLN